MVSWERATAHFLSIVRLESIKSKIIVFALLATCIPSLTMGWLSYVKNKQILNEKITQELHNVASQASREFDVWFKERVYEVKVFTNSYIVPESLERLLESKRGTKLDRRSLTRLRDYLESLRTKFAVYEELMIVDERGRTLATSSKNKTAVLMPEGWLRAAKSGDPLISHPMWDKSLEVGVMVITQPIFAERERLLGVMAAKLNFQKIVGVLDNYNLGDESEVYLITKEGAVFTTDRPISSEFMKISLGKSYTAKLYSRESFLYDYVNYRGKEVMGTFKTVLSLSWGIVAEKDKEKAYANIIRLRNLTVGLVMILLCVIGLAAYLLGLTIVRPLQQAYWRRRQGRPRRPGGGSPSAGWRGAELHHQGV